MSSDRGRSPCDTGPIELRLEVIVPGTLAGRCVATRSTELVQRVGEQNVRSDGVVVLLETRLIPVACAGDYPGHPTMRTTWLTRRQRQLLRTRTPCGATAAHGSECRRRATSSPRRAGCRRPPPGWPCRRRPRASRTTRPERGARARSGAVVGEERRFMRMADEPERAHRAVGQDSCGRRLGEEPEQGVARRAVPAVDAVTPGLCAARQPEHVASASDDPVWSERPGVVISGDQKVELTCRAE